MDGVPCALSYELRPGLWLSGCSSVESDHACSTSREAVRGTTFGVARRPAEVEQDMTVRCGCAALLLSVALCPGAMAADADWPCWRGPTRDGRSPDTGLLKQWPEAGPRKLWQADGIGSGYSTVSIGWGAIYTTGDVDGKLRLFALDLDGKAKWQIDHDNAWTQRKPLGARATPTLHDGRLYLLSGNGLLGCRDAGDGKLIWSRKMSEFGGKTPAWGYSESVLIHDGKAIVTPGGKQCIVALDAATGELAWTSEGLDAGAEYGSCIVVQRPNVTAIVGVTKPGMVAVRADNGQKLWTNDYSRGGGVNVPTPLFSDSHLFWPNGFSKGAICLRLDEDAMPAIAWTTDKDRECHLGDFVIDQGHLYGHHGGHWKCIELRTGKVKWAEKGVGNGSVTWADGMLYMFSESRGIAGLAVCTPEKYEPRGRFQVEGRGRSWAHPVVIGGRLYLRYDTHLYCFDVKTR